jgi:hypothetical protein
MQDMEMSTRNNGTANPTHGRMAKNTMHRRSNRGANPRKGGEKRGMTKKI